MSNTNYNIAIIGQTGVGKTSLLNYLFGKEIAKTGIGKPVTTNGFHEYKHQIQGMSVNIYDSWGLEVGKEEQWQKEFEQELKRRGIQSAASEWFHSVFYCINAGSSRIQDSDIEIIKRLLEKKYVVTVILTKADTINEEDEKTFVKTIHENISPILKIIPVCSENKITRMGEVKAFGKEEIELQSVKDLINSLKLRIPEHCRIVLNKKLEEQCEGLEKFIEDTLSWFDINSKQVATNLEKLIRKYNGEINILSKDCVSQSLSDYQAIFQHISIYFGKNNPHINSFTNEEDDSFQWLHIGDFSPIQLVLMPVAMILGLFTRDSSKQKMITKIEDYKQQRQREIAIYIRDLKNELSDIQNKIMQKLLT